MIQKIILVFKTHFDIGFTDLAGRVVENYASGMLDRVLETCEATAGMGRQRYVWTMPSWPLTRMLEECTQDRRERLERLIREDQIVWHALPFTSHFDFCGLDDYRYGFTYARRLSERYGKPFPISAKMTDVPGHGAMLASVLARQGVRFLHLGSNEFIRPPKVPALFYWEAPDGRRVLTMYSKGYGSGIEPPKDWPYPVWMALMHTNDNCGPQSAQIIGELVEKLGRRYPEAEIVCGTMDDFFRSLEGEDLEQLPVVRKDLADTWIHGVGSYPKEVRLVRETRRRMKRLERLLSEKRSALSGAEKEEMEKLRAVCYENLLLFGEHTWGLDVKTWMPKERAYDAEGFARERQQESARRMETSWQEQRDRAQAAVLASKRLEQLLAAGNSVEAADGVEAAAGGKAAGKQREKTEIAPEAVVKISAPGVAENAWYRLHFNPDTGDILLLWEKKRKRALLAASGGKPAVYYQYDRYGIEDMTHYLKKAARRLTDWGIRDNGKDGYPECGHICVLPEFERWELRGNAVVFHYRNPASAELYGNAEKLRLIWSLESAQAMLTAEAEAKKASPYTESASLVLQLPMERPDYEINKNGYVLDPARDIADWGNHALYCIEYFAAAGEAGRKVCVVSADAPLLGIGETGIYRMRKKYRESRQPALYFNLFNNMWGTNFPQWIEGSFSYRFLLFAADGQKGEQLRADAERRLMALK
ncbi:MAG: DUF5054 domain-containing protein [Eubacteriales bacterium]|nr:DUF5054 domain-containing protein [Eubacteriales bacterium]